MFLFFFLSFSFNYTINIGTKPFLNEYQIWLVKGTVCKWVKWVGRTKKGKQGMKMFIAIKIGIKETRTGYHPFYLSNLSTFLTSLTNKPIYPTYVRTYIRIYILACVQMLVYVCICIYVIIRTCNVTRYMPRWKNYLAIRTRNIRYD